MAGELDDLFTEIHPPDDDGDAAGDDDMAL